MCMRRDAGEILGVQDVHLSDLERQSTHGVLIFFSSTLSGKGCSNLSFENPDANPKNRTLNRHRVTTEVHTVCMGGDDVWTLAVQETRLSCRSTVAYTSKVLSQTSNAPT